MAEVLKQRCWQASLRERVSKIADELCEDKDKLQKQLDETRQELQRVRASQTHSPARSDQAWEQEKAALTERIRELEARCSSVTQVFRVLFSRRLRVRALVVYSQVALCLRCRLFGACLGPSRWHVRPSRLWGHRDCALWCRPPPFV